MTTPDLERRIRTWFADEIGETEAAPSSVYAFLGAIPRSMPREHGLFGRRTFVLLAAALLVGLLAGAIAVGSGLVKLPSILPLPAPSPLVIESPSASPQPRVGVVAYMRSGRIWVVNVDGTEARELVRHEPVQGAPAWQDSPELQNPIAWSPDGSRLYYQFVRTEFAGPDDGIGTGHCGLAATDASGSEPVVLLDLSAGENPSGDLWCPAMDAGSPQPNPDGMVISPDGTRLAYSFGEGGDLAISTIAVFDLASRQVRRLDSTQTQTSLLDSCTTEASQGVNEFPSWSPDGTRLVFGRQVIGPRVNGFCQSTIFTVKVDGTDLRRLAPPDVPALAPRWSPDGSVIIFHSAPTYDIYAVRPDGSGLRALTSDGVSVWPHWTRDGRIVFLRSITPDGDGDLWIMDADGGNATPVDATIPALTAAGCLVCPYPNDQNQFWALWQPVP
jgi:Tol biopolymer transport system component